MEKLYVGIDFGTSNSNAAVWNGRNAEIIEMPDGKKSMPSVVAILGDEVLVGVDALKRGRSDMGRYLFRHFKRNLGERFSEATDAGYQTCPDDAGFIAWRGPNGLVYTTVELASFVFEELLDAAETKLGRRPTGAVVTIPAETTKAQDEATVAAAKLAGLEDVILRREPTMAALAYGFDFARPRRIAVIDHGGGTFDISIIQTGKGREGQELTEVRATDGRRRGLGGIDFDKRIASYLAKVFRTKNPNSDITADDFAMARVLEAAEEAKIELSRNPNRADVRVSDLVNDADGVPVSLSETFDIRTLEELTTQITDSIAAICRRAIDKVREKDANFSIHDINDVVLVGGMTRSPIVRNAVKSVFGKEPRKDINPEEAVALGAAIEAARIMGAKPGLTVRDITPRTFAIEATGGVAATLFPAGSTYPCDDKAVTVRNAGDGQSALSVALLEGNGLRADEYEIIGSHDHVIEAPGAAKSNGLKLKIRLDDRGRLRVEAENGWTFGDEA